MANEKKLIIGADVSGIDKSFKQVKKMLEGLQKEGIKVSNVLKDMTIEKNHGMGKFAKSISTSSQKMKDFRGITEDTAKVMKGVWQRTMMQEQHSLDRTSRQLEKLNKLRKEQMNYLSVSKQYGGGGDRYQSNVDRIDTIIASKVAERMSRQDALSELRPGVAQRPWYSVRDSFRTGIATGQAVIGGAAQMLGTYQSTKTLPSQNIAALHGFEKNLLGRMAGGDFSDLYFMHNKGFGGNTSNALSYGMNKAGGTAAARWQTGMSFASHGLDAIGGAMQIAPGIGRGVGGVGGGAGGALRTQDNANFPAGAGSMAGGINGGYRDIINATSGGSNVAEAQSVETQLAAQRAQSPFSEAALNFTSSTAAMRVAGSKALQGRHMGAWMTGKGYGLDMGESMAAASMLARMGGTEMAMGRGGGTATDHLSVKGAARRFIDGSGRNFNPKEMNGLVSGIRGLPLSAIGELGPGYQSAMGGYSQDEAQLKGQGYSSGKRNADGTVDFSRSRQTKGSTGLFGEMLKMESQGMDRGAAGQMLTQMSFANGGDNGRAIKQMQEVMSKAFSVGLKDARLGEEIGKATAEAAIGGSGGRLTDASAYGSLLTGGLNKNSTLFDVQSNIGGAASFNDRMNKNSYFNAIKMEAGKNALGPEGTHTQMLALQNASLGDLVGESKTLKTAGIDGKVRSQIVHSMANAGVASYLERGDKSMQDLQKGLDSNKGDLINSLRAAKGKKDGSFEKMVSQYGTLMNTSMPGRSEEEYEGEARMLSNFGDKTKGKGVGYKNHTDQVASKTVEAQQAILEKLYEKEISMRKPYLEALEKSGDFVDAIADNDDNKSFQAFEDIMKKFIEIVEQALKHKALPPQGSQRGR